MCTVSLCVGSFLASPDLRDQKESPLSTGRYVIGYFWPPARLSANGRAREGISMLARSFETNKTNTLSHLLLREPAIVVTMGGAESRPPKAKTPKSGRQAFDSTKWLLCWQAKKVSGRTGTPLETTELQAFVTRHIL